jgi:hypothetical protein
VFEELDFRAGDGIQVSLLWERCSNAVLVAVLDWQRGLYFEIPVKPGQRALDVFHHPFTYRRQASTSNRAQAARHGQRHAQQQGTSHDRHRS